MATAGALVLQAGIATAGDQRPLDPVVLHALEGSSAAAGGEETKGAPAPRSAGSVRLFHCDEAPGGRCGIVRVPLDRARPNRRQVPIFFEYYRPLDGKPTKQAVVTSLGGPGASATQEPFFSDFMKDTVLAPALKHRAFVVVDQRGVGNSEVVKCPQLQHGTDHIYRAVKGCGQQLGHAAQLYSSHDVALDLEAIRKALGFKKLNLFGASYAGMDIQAYVTRFPEHVRTAVLDGPTAFPEYDPLFAEGVRAHQRAAQLICERSASCSTERNAPDSVAWLAERLRDDPVEGVGFDAGGEPHDVVVTEAFLAWNLMWTNQGGLVSLSEIGAAADALAAGDETPLLRLAAEHDGPVFGDEGPARSFSAGTNWARYCTDMPMLWDKQAPIATRREQYRDARDELPDDAFAPYSIDAWLAPPPIGAYGPDPCVAWPAPGGDIPPAPIPAGADLPAEVPALILNGDFDLDTPTAESQDLADAWPNSQLIEIAGAEHTTAVTARFECSAQLIQNFIEELDPGDPSCAEDEDAISFPAVGRFAGTVAEAVPATVNDPDRDDSTGLDRKVATVTAATATDAIRRAFLQEQPTRAKALRGGSFKPEFVGPAVIADLRGARFAEDVAVDGSVEYPFGSEVLDADVTVDGPGAENGTLHIKGVWFGFRAPTTELRVRGSLDGRQLSLRVPAS